MTKFNNKLAMKSGFFLVSLLGLCLFMVNVVNAQSVGAGIDAASTEVKSVFGNVSTLILVIGGIVGLVGAIRVFIKWQNGDQDINKHLVGWLGACVFLLLVGGILRAIFPV